MPRVEVTIRLRDQLVEQRSFQFRKVLRIGEGAGSKLILPCAPIDLTKEGDAIVVRGVRLLVHDSLTVRMDSLEIGFTHLASTVRASGLVSKWGVDGRFAASLMVAILCVAWWDKARLQFQSSGPGMAGASDAFVIEADSTSEAGVAREESANGLKGGQFRSGQIAEDGRTGVGWGQWAYPGKLGWLAEAEIGPVVNLYLQGLFGEALGIEAESGEELLYQGHALVILGEPNRAIELYSQALARDEVLETQVSLHLSIARSLRGEAHLWDGVDIRNHGRAMEQAITAVRHVPGGGIDIALSEIDTLLSDWNRWSELDRQEFRVTIASHPALERLRAHPGLLSLLYRHMGSTAPSRMR